MIRTTHVIRERESSGKSAGVGAKRRSKAQRKKGSAGKSVMTSTGGRRAHGIREQESSGRSASVNAESEHKAQRKRGSAGKSVTRSTGGRREEEKGEGSHWDPSWISWAPSSKCCN